MAAENITVAYTMLKNSIGNTEVFGLSWILPTILLILILLIITRDINKWKILALPTAVLLKIIGLNISYPVLLATGIIFAVESLSTQTIGSIIDTIRGKKQRTMLVEELERKQRATVRKDIGKGITGFKQLLDRDITRTIAQTRTGFSGAWGRRNINQKEYEQIQKDLLARRQLERTQATIRKAKRRRNIFEALQKGRIAEIERKKETMTGAGYEKYKKKQEAGKQGRKLRYWGVLKRAETKPMGEYEKGMFTKEITPRNRYTGTWKKGQSYWGTRKSPFTKQTKLVEITKNKPRTEWMRNIRITRPEQYIKPASKGLARILKARKKRRLESELFR